MRKFMIDYKLGDTVHTEIVEAKSSLEACKTLIDTLRKRGMPVNLSVSRIKMLKD